MLNKLAILLDKISVKIKKSNCKRSYKAFIKKYNLTDGSKHQKTIVSYNSYEGTSISLAQKLVSSGEINKDDKIFDIGCGAGIFLSFLWVNGYKNLQGIELNKELYDLCVNNLEMLGCPTKKIFNEDAIYFSGYDDSNVFYLFNPFYDSDTYLKWIENIRNSYLRNKRKIKLVILFPTISSVSAINNNKWLKKKTRIYDENQVCSKCVNYLIYESED